MKRDLFVAHKLIPTKCSSFGQKGTRVKTLSFIGLFLWAWPCTTYSQEPDIVQIPSDNATIRYNRAVMKGYADKYGVSVPLNITGKSKWYDKLLCQEALSEYMNGEITNLGFMKFGYLRFDGDTVWIKGYAPPNKILGLATGNSFFSSCGVALDGLFEDEVNLFTYIEEEGVKSDTVKGMNHQHYFSYSSENEDAVDGINKKFLDKSRIKVDALWSAMVNAVDALDGFELNQKTHKKSGKSRKIHTLPHVEVNDGFVIKYYVEIEMNIRSVAGYDVMDITTLLYVWRRRASAANNTWTYHKVGDGFSMVSQSQEKATPVNSSVPVWKAILKVLKK